MCFPKNGDCYVQYQKVNIVIDKDSVGGKALQKVIRYEILFLYKYKENFVVWDHSYKK